MRDDPFSQWRSGRLRREAVARRVLGVSDDAGRDEIRRAYRSLALRLHPDMNPGGAGSGERFINLNNAYMTLMKGKDAPLIPPPDEYAPIDLPEEDYIKWMRKRFGI